ncbi:MAG: phosphomannomutase/phosphoglucomutase [Candidatus Doudnabacteria bacterium]
MQVDSSIFKAYDIRGVYPDQLTAETAYAIGRAFATLIQKENPDKELTIGVGGDMRLSTPELKEQVIRAISESGINVVDIGLASTPTFYFSIGYLELDAGIQVSASHNPKQYNGFKMVRAKGVAVGGDSGIKEMLQTILDESFVAKADKAGSVEIKEHMEKVAASELYKLAGEPDIPQLKIVIDTANAMGIPDYKALFDILNPELVTMNFELDGTFPAHEADPLKPENTQDLRERVVTEGADLGIASDGDSDRVFLIDEKGETIPSPILYTILAHIEREEFPNDPLAYEIRLGNLVEEEFAGAKLVQTPVGHSIIKSFMVKENAVFGGEISGHYFFRLPWGTYEAPMLLIIKFLQWLSGQDKPLSEIVASYKRYVSSGEVNTKVTSREEVEEKIEEIKEKYSDGKQTTIDGVKVSYSDFWFSVRASNTEPVMRLIVEAKDQAVMEAKRDEILAVIRS